MLYDCSGVRWDGLGEDFKSLLIVLCLTSLEHEGHASSSGILVFKGLNTPHMMKSVFGPEEINNLQMLLFIHLHLCDPFVSTQCN